MIQKKTWLVIALLIAFVAVGIGCFTLGRNTASSYYEAERDLNIRLNRSELDGLGKIEGPIYVTGHRSPDADTVGSSIACAALLRELGYDARPVVLGQINNETKYILEAAGLDAPEVLEDAAECNMVLVDHSEYTHSAEGLRDATILSIIDHPGDGAVTIGNQLIYEERTHG